MKDQYKTKGQLIDELAVLRQRVAELEKSEIERKQSEGALYEIEEMFRLFMDYSPIYVFFKDENIRSIQLSKNYEKMIGRPVQELIGKTMDDLFPSELAKSMVEDDLRILRERKPLEVVEELNGRFYTTTKFPITREGKPPLLAGFTIDITERKRVEEALRKSEEYFRRLTKQSPAPIAIIGDSGEVDFLNERFSATFGYTLDDLPNLGAWWQLAYPDEQYRQEVIATWQEAMERAGSKPGDIEPHEYRVMCKDGTIRIVEIFGSRIGNKILVLLNDITERKQAEDELRKSREQLRGLSSHVESIREEERTRLAREMHDDLGQNLTALKINLSWLLQELPKEQKILVEKTNSSVKIIDSTFDSVRRICSELRPPVLDNFGLLAALEWQAVDFQNRTQISCNFRSNLEEDLLNRDCSTTVFRIFQEVLTNVARHAKANEVDIILGSDSSNLVLEVEDNGRGITENEVSVPKSFGLLGIRERALLLGGEVNITGVPGQGTKITIIIPLKI